VSTMEKKHLEKKRVAIIGSGISGLMCAYLLSRHHKVTVFEAGHEIGGHTATKTVSLGDEQVDVDTGFIVFNDRTYPSFLKLLAELKVPYQATEMGFSVSCREKDFEYSGTSFNGLFAQRKNLFKLSHWRMLKDILRFNKECIHMHDTNTIPTDKTLGQYLHEANYGKEFKDLYILPMVSAIWSAELTTAAAMPLLFFIQFFHNHGLLTVTQQPQWFTIIGGSKQYLEPLTKPYLDSIYTDCPVLSVKRYKHTVELTTKKFGHQEYDEVVFACHSDQALKLLTDVTEKEYDILGKISYIPNRVTLHTDTNLLPQSRRAWASWNYLLLNKRQESMVLTYNMNILQRLNSTQTFCVSVNADGLIDENKIIGIYEYSHPMFTLESVAAQSRWAEISGVNHTHFCGAYWRNGFHEDGVVSAIGVAQALGIVW
jgi:uncharacterized protein